MDNEKISNDAVRLVLSVMPNGDFNAIGGDRKLGPEGSDMPYLGMERINSRLASEHKKQETCSLRKINADQVAWLYNALGRYIDTNEKPAVSRAGEMKVYGCMYEIMEVLNLKFEDDIARSNGTPKDVRQIL